MRFHRNYGQLQLWRARSDLLAFVRAENLVAARLEPVIRQGLAHTALDLMFRSAERYLTVAAIVVDAPQLVLREADRLVWPAEIAESVSDRDAYSIEEMLVPWMRSISLARSLSTERIRHFGRAEDKRAFEAARAMNIVGTAPFERSVRALAPYVYGARYAFGKNVLVSGAADGLQGAAFLQRVARAVTVRSFDARELEFAQRWLPLLPADSPPALMDVFFSSAGAEIPDDVARAPGAVHIRVDATATNAEEEQQIAAAVFPLDILFTNEVLHGPSVREFTTLVPRVSCPERQTAVAAYEVAGGSSGRILFGMRRGWDTAPDGDADSARILAGYLRAEGFTVDMTSEPTTCDYGSYDLVHCFNLIEVPNAAAFLMNARRAGVRTILTATFLDVAGEKRQWGTSTHPVCFKQEIDEASIRGYLSFLERRALLAPGWESDTRRGPIENFDAMVRETLGLCDMVIAECDAEAALLAQFGYKGEVRTIRPFLNAPQGPAMVAPPVGFGRFALVHAPVEPRNNQLSIVRAARDSGIPVVLAGAVTDMEYAARVREASDESIVQIEPDELQVQWLYATAEAVVDYSWYGYGTQRLWRAVLSGARVCASTSGWGPGLLGDAVTPVDPAALPTLVHAIAHGDAPSAEVRTSLAAGHDPGVLLRNVLSAYTGAVPYASRP